MKLFGQDMTKREWMKRVGDISQVAGVRNFSYDSGSARGMKAADVRDGDGFDFTVLFDRGMDIAQCTYKGAPISHISKTGVVAPQLCEESDFLRGFACGLLTTCGYTYMGAANEDEGRQLGLHGRGHMLPADEIASYGEWVDDDYVSVLRGRMHESCVFDENIHLTRTVTCAAGSNTLVISDEFENAGFDPQPFMLLYHINFGYPIVSEHTRLITSQSNGVRPRDETAAAGLSEHTRFSAPVHGYREQCFYHDLAANEQGHAWACLYNEAMELGAYVKYEPAKLPYLVQWKQIGEGDYVCGLEPATNKPEGRAAARAAGELSYIQPGEKRRYHIQIGVVAGKMPENL